ncbi:unnamed protein product [Effrenium voratum]|nr:unnamed protein product [Effrenium voratum]
MRGPPAAPSASWRAWLTSEARNATVAEHFLLLGCQKMRAPPAARSAGWRTWLTSNIRDATVAEHGPISVCQTMRVPAAAPSASWRAWLTSEIQSALFAERMRVIQMLLANRGGFAQGTPPKSVLTCCPHHPGLVLQVSFWISWRRSKASNSRFVRDLTKQPAHGLGRSLPDWSQIERCGLTHMIHSGGKHPEHLSFTCVGGKTSPELHRETFERLDLFLEQNLRVFYVWEHEFTEWRKLAATGEAPPISRILRRHTKRSSKARRTAKKSAKTAAGAKRHAS